MKLRMVTYGLIASMSLGAGVAAAQEKKEGKKPEPAAKPAAKPQDGAKPAAKPAQDDKKGAPEAGMTPEMMQAMSPGDQHKLLASLAGKWTETVKFKMTPDAPESEAKGTVEYEVIMGGRWVVQKVKSEMEGMPFEGMGVHGYDNMKKKYVSVWMDNMGTGMMQSEGMADASGKTINFTWEYADPMSGGKTKKGRSMMHIEKDKVVYEMFDAGPDGKEFRCLQVTDTK